LEPWTLVGSRTGAAKVVVDHFHVAEAKLAGSVG